jgi:uncharacterized protein YeaO (DUF488 family)
MLYTSSLSVFEKSKKKLKPYYLMENCGNDAVLPDQSDLEQYKKGELTWQGFSVNYLAKLMRAEAEEWMRHVSEEAVSEDVVLVSKEDMEHCYRIQLAEMMNSMFSGRMKVRYMGELND